MVKLVLPGLAFLSSAGSCWGDLSHGKEWDGQRGISDIIWYW